MMVLQPDWMPIFFGIGIFRQRAQALSKTFRMTIVIQSPCFASVSRFDDLVTAEVKDDLPDRIES
jgi:hypothetical protein